MVDEKLKRVLNEMGKLKKQNESPLNDINIGIDEATCNTYETLSAQLFNINRGHCDLISEIRKKNAGVVKQLVEHLEK
jgi:hypothetical protein